MIVQSNDILLLYLLLAALGEEYTLCCTQVHEFSNSPWPPIRPSWCIRDCRVLVVGTQPQLWKTPLSSLARQHRNWINQRGEIKGAGEEGIEGGYLTSAFLNWALNSGGMLLSSTLNCYECWWILNYYLTFDPTCILTLHHYPLKMSYFYWSIYQL